MVISTIISSSHVYEYVVEGLNDQSKATERSSKVGALTLLLFMLSTISLCILRRAASVEWNLLYADCR